MSTISQLLANALISGSIIALVGLSFGVVFHTTRFFHVAHAAILTAAPYVAQSLHGRLGVPVVLAVAGGLLAVTLLGILIERGIYRPLRARGATVQVKLIASLGAFIVIQNTISLLYGDDVRTLPWGGRRAGPPYLGARVTAVQWITVGACLLAWLGLTVGLSSTGLGRVMRAVGDNALLADPGRAPRSGLCPDHGAGVVSRRGRLDPGRLRHGIHAGAGFRPPLAGHGGNDRGRVGSIHGTALAGLLLGLSAELGAGSSRPTGKRRSRSPS